MKTLSTTNFEPIAALTKQDRSLGGPQESKLAIRPSPVFPPAKAWWWFLATKESMLKRSVSRTPLVALEAINRLRIIFLILLLIGGCQGASGQSLFRNLNFEQAKIIPLEGGSYYPHEVATTNGIPYWTAYTWDGSDPSIHYDDVALDSPWVSIHDTTSPWVPVLEGQYTMFLQSSPFFGIEVAIAQTGWVPVSAKSIRFLSGNFRGLRVRFEANEIPIALLGQSADTSGYIWGGDISQFAGQTGELRFSGGAPLDDIKFSADPMPTHPSLSDPKLNVDGSFEFQLLGQTGQTYTVQFSTNFTNWTSVTNVAGSVGPITIMDPGATNAPARFYRAVSP